MSSAKLEDQLLLKLPDVTIRFFFPQNKSFIELTTLLRQLIHDIQQRSFHFFKLQDMIDQVSMSLSGYDVLIDCLNTR